MRKFPRYAGIGVSLFGLLDIASWYRHWRFILQIAPSSAPMQYNTALCFTLIGAGLVLLTTRRALFAPWLGAVAAIIPTATLVESISGRDLGIDPLFPRDDSGGAGDRLAGEDAVVSGLQSPEFGRAVGALGIQ